MLNNFSLPLNVSPSIEANLYNSTPNTYEIRINIFWFISFGILTSEEPDPLLIDDYENAFLVIDASCDVENFEVIDEQLMLNGEPATQELLFESFEDDLKEDRIVIVKK